MHDLNGTNPDLRCFQQNCHGVVFVQNKKFSESPEKQRRIISEKYKKYLQEDPHQGAHGLSTRVGGAPLPRGPPGALPTYPHILYLHVRGEKIREKELSRFTRRSRRQALISLGRADLESVRGSGEWRSSPSSSSTFLHHQFHDAHRRA